MKNHQPETEALHHRARKRFGQNFLRNPHIIEKIISAIGPRDNEAIIEIGPGLGALTQHLLNSNCQLSAVEVDHDLAALLQENYPELTLLVSDALKTDFANLIGKDNKAKVVGNLPYNISTPLLFHLLQFKQHCSAMYFMLQKEVVDRMAASENNKTYGRLSVMMQYHCRVEPLLDIPPSAFNPEPKVNSTFVRITPRDFPITLDNPKLLSSVVSAVFSQRRKTLRNGLKTQWGDHLSELPKEWLSQRPENLSVRNYVTLCNSLHTFESQQLEKRHS